MRKRLLDVKFDWGWACIVVALLLAAYATFGGGVIPTPTPTEAVRALVIEEQSARTAEQGIIYGSQRVRQAFSGGFQVEDKDVKGPDGKTPPALKPFIERAIPRGLPYIYLFDKDGATVREAGLPATVDEVLKFKEGRP